MNAQPESMAHALVFNPEQTRRMALANEAIRKLRRFDVFKVLQVDTNTSRPVVMVNAPLTDLAERLGASCIVSHSVGDGYLVMITAYEVNWCWRQTEPGTTQRRGALVPAQIVEPRPAAGISSPAPANECRGANVIPLIGGTHV